MTEDLKELANRVMDEMLEFGEGVIAYQTRDLRREDYDYSVLGLEVLSGAFMAGAMLVVSERYELPTPPRDVALLGLLNHLTTKRKMKFETAQGWVANLNEAAEGSIGRTAFQSGYEHWRRPDALAILMRTEKPKDWWSESWTEWNRAPSKRIVTWCALGFGTLALLLVGWIIGRIW